MTTTQSGFTERWLHQMVENSWVHLGLSIAFPIKIIDIMHIILYTFLHEYMHVFILRCPRGRLWDRYSVNWPNLKTDIR